MPRPRRDYGVAIREDLSKLDLKIRDLLKRRARLLRMLADYESEIDVDLGNALREFAPADARAPSVTKTRKRRSR